MKRSILREPPAAEEVIRTFPTVEHLEAFLHRRVQETDKPYLAMPYLAYGRHDWFTGETAERGVVLSNPRVFVLPQIGWDGFQLRIEVPRVVGAEEVEPGRWQFDEEHVPVEAEQFRVWHPWKATQGRYDGFEELRIVDHVSKVLDVDEENPDPEVVCFSWLRLSLEDPAKHRTEESETERLALLLAAVD